MRHTRALAARTGVVDEVGHRERPAPDHGNFPSQLRHTVGDLRQLRSDGVGQDHFCASFLRLEQLRGHVHVLNVELFDGHCLDIFQRQCPLQIFTAQLAVIGRVCQDRDILEFAAGDRLFHNHGCLNAVVRSIAEDVVLGLVVKLVRHDGAGCYVVHHRDPRLLVEALRSQCYASINEAHRGDNFLAHQFLGDLHAALVFRLVVPLDQFDFPTEHATGFVNFLDR